MNLRRLSMLVALLLLGGSCAAEAAKERILWSWELWNFGLYLSDRDGSNERAFLANSGSNYNPSFSADGRWIVFTSERFGSAAVFRAHPDGSGLERLTDSSAMDDQGVLSPDGRTLAFVSTRQGGTANIWLQNIGRKTRAHHLTNNRAGNFRPSWSPDGQWIAFSSDRNTHRVRLVRDTGPAWELLQTTAIYIVHPDGGGLKRLTPLEGSAGSPKWSPDGRQVIFAEVIDVEAMLHGRTTTRIVSVDINTGAREVHADRTSGAVSPSFVGKTEIGYRADGIVYTSGRKGPAAASNSWFTPQNPSWAPGGALLVYDKRELLKRRSVEITPSRDPRYEFIGGTGVLDRFPPPVAVTSDGNGFIYASENNKSLIHSAWDGTGSRVIFEAGADRSIGEPTLSPDDRKLVFTIWKSPHPEAEGQLAVTDADGSHLRLVPDDQGHRGCNFMSLSPDGTQLVCATGGLEGGVRTKAGLRIVSLADGKTVKLTGGWDNTPAWSPRGDRIAFTGFETGDFEIYTIHPDGTGLRQLTHTHGNDAHPIWSPDGRWIAFTSSRMGWKDEAMLPWHGPQSYGEIFVMHPDGTDVRQLTDNQWEEAASAWVPRSSGPNGSTTSQGGVDSRP